MTKMQDHEKLKNIKAKILCWCEKNKGYVAAIVHNSEQKITSPPTPVVSIYELEKFLEEL